MNETENNEQPQTPESGEDKDAGKIFLYGNTTLQSREEFEADKNKDTPAEDSDNKPVNSDIGDGTMKDEGLANAPEPGLFNNDTYGDIREQSADQ